MTADKALLSLTSVSPYGMKDGLRLKVGDWRLWHVASKDSCYGDLQVGESTWSRPPIMSSQEQNFEVSSPSG